MGEEKVGKELTWGKKLSVTLACLNEWKNMYDPCFMCLQVLACMAGYGALFDQVNSQGDTPIHSAANGGHAMCLKFLGQRGNNIAMCT